MIIKMTLIIITFSCLLSSTSRAEDDHGLPVKMSNRYHLFFKKYCTECHNHETQEGKLRLDNISFTFNTIENAERWQKILNQINSGEMPPEDSQQPEKLMKTEFLDALSQTLARARKALSDSGGRITMRRLNRREYKNTIRQLLGIELDVRNLPDDRGVGNFDTDGASLFMSSDQFEQYLALGRQALDEAFSRSQYQSTKTKSQRLSNHRETEERAKRVVRGTFNAYYLGGYKKAKKWQASDRSKPPREFGLSDETEIKYRIQAFEKYGPSYAAYLANPLSDTGSLLSSYSVMDEVIALPADPLPDWGRKNNPEPVPSGNYLLRMRIGATSKKSQKNLFVEMGTRTKNVKFALKRSFQITGTVLKPQIIEINVSITTNGPRSFVFREKRPKSVNDKSFLKAIKETGVIPNPSLWIDWVEWEGPLPLKQEGISFRNLLAKPDNRISESQQAQKVIKQFAINAFRGKTPDQDFIHRLVKLFERFRQLGHSYEESLKEPLTAILASPGFLYLSEPKTETQPRDLTSLELASRLSYFLWSAPPDNQLLTLVRNNKLRNKTVLTQQVNRMIADDKSHQFVKGFTDQWLGIDRLDFFQFNHKLYPDFDEGTKLAAKNEIFETVDYLLRNKGSLRSLLKSDFIIVNALLANYYGIKGVTGDDFQRVSLPANSPRGGLLGMAAILAMGSNGEITSPVERGSWVLRKLLNNPPSPAPPNVPQLSRLEGKLLTTRERIIAHQEEPQCASCHRKIDPIGFGLENFNAVGQWRTEDSYHKKGIGKKSWRIDPSGAFYNGPAFQDYFQLRNLIAARSEDFSRGFTEALIEYALGRPYGFSDEELTTKVVTYAKTRNDTLIDFIQAIVASKQFHRK